MSGYQQAREWVNRVRRAWNDQRGERAAWRSWRQRGFGPPAPPSVKRRVLMRWGLRDATWIETGTYHGQTAEFLAKNVERVLTLEPQPALFRMASRRLSRFQNVEIVNGTSEELLPSILERLTGNVCLWLDGHYSAGATYRGSVDTPIQDELSVVGAALGSLAEVVVFVDDVRCFDSPDEQYAQYPAKRLLIDWADAHQLWWTIEHDIFVAMRPRPARRL